MPPARSRLLLLPFLAALVLIFYSKALRDRISDIALQPFSVKKKPTTPDFGQYVALNTLSKDEFPLDDPNRRVIVVGDIHGMDYHLQKLLNKLSYDSSSDVLVHTGDIVAKGPHDGSMAVISYMTKNNITGVRGNHDQKVIEWRAWINWIHSLEGGNEWLTSARSSWKHASSKGASLEDWLAEKIHNPDSHWWSRIPTDWILFGDHYTIARALSDDEYTYLLNLPLCLHIPTAHTFVAHAGIMPQDLRWNTHDRRQPLARVPTPPSDSEITDDEYNEDDETDSLKGGESIISTLRTIQESLLLNISHNRDAYVLLNVRSISSHKPTRRKDGTPWTDLWNRDMNLCSGFYDSSSDESEQAALPCYPSTVLYGHAASRGLDVKRWSIGLDTGCVYERKLTAVVLGRAARGLPKEAYGKDESRIHYGDRGHGRLVSVKCH